MNPYDAFASTLPSTAGFTALSGFREAFSGNDQSRVFRVVPALRMKSLSSLVELITLFQPRHYASALV